MKSSSKTTITEERGLAVLRIMNVTDADTGTIKCVIKNSLAEDSREIQLQLTGEVIAPKILDKSKSIEVNADERVEFFAKVSGSPQPTIAWSRKGVALSSNQHYEFRTENDTHYLLVKKAVADVMGTYVVTATNKGGKASAEMNLSIKGKNIPISKSFVD